jgi:hypothetical protein
MGHAGTGMSAIRVRSRAHVRVAGHRRRIDPPRRSLLPATLLALAVLASTIVVVPLTWLPRPVAYGASGGEAWADHYDGPVDNYSIAFDVAISRDSRKAIVTGGSWAPTKGYDFATIAYGVTNGPRLWVRRYDGPDSLSDVAYSVAISPNGSTAFVVGKSDSDVHLDDYLTIAYSLK